MRKFRILVSAVLLCSVFYPGTSLSCQEVWIKGKINSDLTGLGKLGVSGALVKIYNKNGIEVERKTNPEGSFEAKTSFHDINDLTINVTANGFFDLTEERLYKTAIFKDSLYTVELDLKPRFVIKGEVKDAQTERPIEGVSIYHFEGTKAIHERSTDDLGNFSFASESAEVFVTFTKVGYIDNKVAIQAPFPYTTRDPKVFFMEKWETRAIKVSLDVTDKKTRKRIDSARVLYRDFYLEKDSFAISKTDGVAQLNILPVPNDMKRYEILVQKEGYFDVKASLALLPGENHFTCLMIKEIKPCCACWFWPGVGALTLGAGFGIASNKAYKRYRKFENTNREKDLDKANRRLLISAISFGAAIAAFTGWGDCKLKKRKNEKVGSGILKPNGFIDERGNVQIGATYQLNSNK